MPLTRWAHLNKRPQGSRQGLWGQCGKCGSHITASPQLHGPLLTDPQARGPWGLRREGGHGHHTLVRSRAEPPQNCCCRPQTLGFSLGMMTVPRCSGPSHLLREQAELFSFYSLVHTLTPLSVPREAQPPHLLPQGARTTGRQEGAPVQAGFPRSQDQLLR